MIIDAIFLNLFPVLIGLLQAYYCYLCTGKDLILLDYYSFGKCFASFEFWQYQNNCDSMS